MEVCDHPCLYCDPDNLSAAPTKEGKAYEAYKLTLFYERWGKLMDESHKQAMKERRRRQRRAQNPVTFGNA